MQRVKYLAIVGASVILLGVDPGQAMALAVAVVGGMLVLAIESLLR
jgi:uncharacterized membrane protein YeaQ/YmgE (transglycosylase-associated protein family)